jgi:hypothetical protein
MHTIPQSFDLIGGDESKAALQQTIAKARAYLHDSSRELVSPNTERDEAFDRAFSVQRGTPIARAIRDVLCIDDVGELLPFGGLQGAQLDTAVRTALFGVAA